MKTIMLIAAAFYLPVTAAQSTTVTFGSAIKDVYRLLINDFYIFFPHINKQKILHAK